VTDIVFLLDVDNTLLDNDAVIADLRRHLVEAFGPDCDRRYWEIFEQLRTELGYADYLGALQRYRVERRAKRTCCGSRSFCCTIRLPTASTPVPSRHCRAARARPDRGPLRRRRRLSAAQDRALGLWAAVEGEVLIYIHKEQMLDDVERRYPARRYVMIDDKLRILAAMKAVWGDRLTTVFVRQGHYAHDPSISRGSAGRCHGRGDRGSCGFEDLRI